MKKFITLILVLFCCASCFVACNKENDELKDGRYVVEAELSCYVPAMGGVEFGRPLLDECVLIVDGGEMFLTLKLIKSSVTIYTITCYTFIDAVPEKSEETNPYKIKYGTIGFYKTDGTFTTDGVSYTLSDDTVLNPLNQEVKYVNSITFPIKELKEEYRLSLYINSNVMGTQFCEATSVEQDGSANYPCVLTVNYKNRKGVS